QDELVSAAEKIGARHEGVIVQRKPTTVLVHTKMAEPATEIAATGEAVALGEAHALKTVVGKHIVEIAVHPADRAEGVPGRGRATGAAVDAYSGDDTTDGDARADRAEDDIGVKGGPGVTHARYRVGSPADVAELLDRFATA